MNERDPELEKLYREHSREEPPSALDAKILAAAHRAVESGPRKVGAEATRPQRWWMPLAAAAAIGVVAIGVIQQVPKETAIDATSVATAPTTPAPAPAREVAPPPGAQPPVTTAQRDSLPVDANLLAKKQKEAVAPAPPPPPAAAPAENKLAAPKSTVEQDRGRRENKVADDKLVAEPTPFPAAPAPQKTEAAATLEAKRDVPMEQPMADARKDTFREEQRQAPATVGAAAPRAATAPPPAPAPAPAPASRMRAQSEMAAGAVAQSKNVDEELQTLARDPDAWILRIRKLRDDGNTAQALRELKEFRALVPDAERRLPADLKALQP